MAGLLLRHVYKIYAGTGKAKKKLKGEAKKRSGDFVAVKDFNMEIKDGEFIVFVGPSGCGKSTTLRMIAGLEEISGGELYIGDRLVNDVDAKDRDIAMVFQSYALYPHLTAYDNIAFGLKIRKIPVAKVDANGNQIIAIDKKKIIEAAKKLNKLNKTKTALIKTLALNDREVARLTAELSSLTKEIDGASGLTEKQLNKLNLKRVGLENAINSANKEIDYGKEQSVLIDKRLNDAKTELEYFQTTPVPLYNYAHMSKEEIDQKVKWASEILGIEELLDVRPAEMSGGQRQRIALGRAMVRGPKVFLLDEPLSNLDAKLRTAMRSEIVKLHNQLKTTFIYVTHDQIEAMTMGTRIVVMKLGTVQQIDTPTNLFDFPINKFVAGFIGTPQMNFFEVKIKREENKLEVLFKDGQKTYFNLEQLRKINPTYLDGKVHEVYLGARGENLSVVKSASKQKGKSADVNGAKSTNNAIKTTLVIKEVLGNTTQLFVRLEEKGSDYIICLPERNDLISGDTVCVKFNEKFVHLFDKESEVSIMDREYGNE